MKKEFELFQGVEDDLELAEGVRVMPTMHKFSLHHDEIREASKNQQKIHTWELKTYFIEMFFYFTSEFFRNLSL